MPESARLQAPRDHQASGQQVTWRMALGITIGYLGPARRRPYVRNTDSALGFDAVERAPRCFQDQARLALCPES